MDWDFAYFVLALCPLLLCVGYFEYRKSKLLHMERMAAIEKGLSPASLNERPARDYLRRGLLWLIPGLGLAAFLWFASGDFGSAWSGAGVLMTCIGLAHLLYYFAEARRRA